jgi:hypothetical protein
MCQEKVMIINYHNLHKTESAAEDRVLTLTTLWVGNGLGMVIGNIFVILV